MIGFNTFPLICASSSEESPKVICKSFNKRFYRLDGETNMKAVKLVKNYSLILVGGLVFSLGASAQETAPTPTPEQIARQDILKNPPVQINSCRNRLKSMR